jgi:hypothetical protein
VYHSIQSQTTTYLLTTISLGGISLPHGTPSGQTFVRILVAPWLLFPWTLEK